MPESVIDALKKVLFSGYIAEGEKTEEFTKLVAEFIKNPRVVMVHSCTAALTIAYRLAGVGPGTEVITTPLTCIAANVPILALGAKPVWVDCDIDTGMVEPEDIEHLINEKTKAISILHKEGDLARLDEILKIAEKYNIKVIEDAAHAFGAKYKGVNIGNHGDFVCFSFQAVKQMTTGDGGALVCKNEDDYWRARKMKWFGIDKAKRDKENPWNNDVSEWGYKADMNNIAATIGIEQMKYIKDILQKYNKNGLLYSKLLKNIPGVKLIKRDKRDFSTFWAYCLLSENRQTLIKKLEEHGIEAKQIHLRNDVYSIFAESRRELPNIDYFSKRELCIPCGWWITEEDVHRIADVIKTGW